MKWEKFSFTFGLIFLFGISFVFALSSTNYKIDNYAVSQGGDDLSSVNYKTGVVAGVVSGDSSSASYLNELGFYVSSEESSCLNLSRCSEGSSCVIDSDCTLNDGLCTDGICDFTNLNISSTVSTGYDSNGNAKNLTINLTGDLTFLSGNEIRLYGRNATQGGNGGILNITRLNGLINTTSGVIYAQGGYSSGSGNVGGNGGSIYLYYWGLIGKFDDPAPVLSGGSSLDGGSGADGTETYTKDNNSLVDGLRDVDVDGDGHVTIADVSAIGMYYNSILGEEDYSSIKDINNDSKLSVIDISRVGREYDLR